MKCLKLKIKLWSINHNKIQILIYEKTLLRVTMIFLRVIVKNLFQKLTFFEWIKTVHPTCLILNLRQKQWNTFLKALIMANLQIQTVEQILKSFKLKRRISLNGKSLINENTVQIITKMLNVQTITYVQSVMAIDQKLKTGSMICIITINQK